MVTAGCGGDDHALRVFAASSMTDFMGEILAGDSEGSVAHSAEMNLAGSGTLLLQIDEGARADLVVLAGSDHMKQLMKSGDFLPPTEFAITYLSVIVSPTLKGQRLSVQDLWSEQFQGAMCIISAPCGELAMKFGNSLSLDMKGLAREPNVRAVLAKVERGDVDFGLVYETDFLASRAGVGEIPGSEASNFSTAYSFAISKDAKAAARVKTLVDAITGEAGRRTLSELGFKQP